jgi:hypothetical protein
MLLFSKTISEDNLFSENCHYNSLFPNSDTLTASYIRAKLFLESYLMKLLNIYEQTI